MSVEPRSKIGSRAASLRDELVVGTLKKGKHSYAEIAEAFGTTVKKVMAIDRLARARTLIVQRDQAFREASWEANKAITERIRKAERERAGAEELVASAARLLRIEQETSELDRVYTEMIAPLQTNVQLRRQ